MISHWAGRLASAGLALAFAGPAAAAGFEAVALAEGVQLFLPAGDGLTRTNSLVVDRSDGLLVVDAQPTAEAARELLDAIRALTPKPIRYLVLSHPHAEAAGGASAFPPETLVIGHVGCRDALADPAYDFGAELRGLVADPAGWVEPQRRIPTLALRAATDLGDPARPVRLNVHARAHSVGDLTVELPRQGILYVGSLIATERVPYAGDADLERWLGLLNVLIAEPTPTIVGLRGPATDLRAVVQLRDAFAWLRGQIEQGFLERQPPEAIVARVLATPGIDTRLVGARDFLPSLVQRAVDESVAHRTKRGRS